MGKKETQKKKEKAAPPSSSLLDNKKLIAGLVVVGLIAATVGYIFATMGGGGVDVVPAQECGASAIAYMNKNIAQANSIATLVSVTEKNGVYQIAAQYQGRNITLYTSRDCNLLFTSSYNMSRAVTTTPTASPTPTVPPEPVKTARPSTELFVMAFCPFGVQAENAMKPVVDLLGTKSNFTVRYIATVEGTTPESVKSLHGPPEAKEDLRQLCVGRYYPDKMWPYLVDINANCYPNYKNTSVLDACTANATRKLGIDNQKIEVCATGSEGLALLSSDEAITKSLKITGSPTLLINGQKYAGQRTPDAYKQAICDRFLTPPAECSVNLSAQAVGASGTC